MKIINLKRVPPPLPESNPEIPINDPFDPFDKSPALILRKIDNPPNKLHIYEQRKYYRKPKRRIVGETIMCKSELLYFSNLSDLVYIQIDKENPSHHPDMLEITLHTLIKESGDSVLL